MSPKWNAIARCALDLLFAPINANCVSVYQPLKDPLHTKRQKEPQLKGGGSLGEETAISCQISPTHSVCRGGLSEARWGLF